MKTLRQIIFENMSKEEKDLYNDLRNLRKSITDAYVKQTGRIDTMMQGILERNRP